MSTQNIVHVNGQEKQISDKRFSRLKKIAKDMVRKRSTEPELAEEFGLSVRQIQKDKRLIREMQEDSLRMQTIHSYITDCLTRKDEITRELWNIYEETDNPFAKIKSLSKIAEHDRKYFNILRDLGFMIEGQNGDGDGPMDSEGRLGELLDEADLDDEQREELVKVVTPEGDSSSDDESE
jgi:hypothetical protein